MSKYQYKAGDFINDRDDLALLPEGTMLADRHGAQYQATDHCPGIRSRVYMPMQEDSWPITLLPLPMYIDSIPESDLPNRLPDEVEIIGYREDDDTLVIRTDLFGDMEVRRDILRRKTMWRHVDDEGWHVVDDLNGDRNFTALTELLYLAQK